MSAVGAGATVSGLVNCPCVNIPPALSLLAKIALNPLAASDACESWRQFIHPTPHEKFSSVSDCFPAPHHWRSLPRPARLNFLHSDPYVGRL